MMTEILGADSAGMWRMRVVKVEVRTHRCVARPEIKIIPKILDLL
jgi:hypothetical protein